MQELTSIISYRRRSPMNVNEQKFGGYGHFLRNPAGGMIAVIKHFIEVPTVNRTPVSAGNLGPNGELNPALDFLEYVRAEFFRTEKQFNTDAYGCEVDPFLELCGGSEFVMECHTHPDLGVFWSAADRRSGSHRAGNKPLCIFCLLYTSGRERAHLVHRPARPPPGRPRRAHHDLGSRELHGRAPQL